MNAPLTSDIFRRLLGMPPRLAPSWRILHSTQELGFVIETLSIVTGDKAVPGTLLRPKNPNGAAILYCHAHGNRYDLGRAELLWGRPSCPIPLGPQLAQRGLTVLGIDLPGFGDRRSEGSEASLAKAALWRGTTLMGNMLADLTAALMVLRQVDYPDCAPIGVFGLSMGATHAYWLAALDNRIAAVAQACVFADIAPLLESGAHNLHGHYMTVPGLLAAADMGDIAALVAPRPQLIMVGSHDPLTPANALAPALARTRRAYEGTPALVIHEDEQAGHAFTASMRSATLDFFSTTLGEA